MLDSRLVGYWSDATLYIGDMETNDIAFSNDGSGFSYWARVGGVFEMQRFTWRTDNRRLLIHLTRWLFGTWSVQLGRTRHHVTSEGRRDSARETTYRIGRERNVFGDPAIVLSLDRRIGVGAQRYVYLREAF